MEQFLVGLHPNKDLQLGFCENCELYLTVQTIDELKLVNASFTFTFLNHRCDPEVMQTLSKNKISEVRLWFASHGSANMFLFKKAGGGPGARRVHGVDQRADQGPSLTAAREVQRVSADDCLLRLLPAARRGDDGDADGPGGVASADPARVRGVVLAGGGNLGLFPRSRAEVRGNCFQIDAMKDDILRRAGGSGRSTCPIRIR
jgi:hypothetical protein